MPYLIDSHNCVRKQNADGSEGPLLKCFDGDDQAAQDYLAALQANVHNSEIVDFSMSITKASYNTSDLNAPRHWRAVDSDTDADLYDEQMSVELFHDFVDRIDNDIPVPEAFKSIICEESWCGGMPYLSIAHYKAGENAKNVPGKVDAIYVDGTRLKSKGSLDDTPLGREVFASLCEDAMKHKSGDNSHKPVRISIGFLDLQHKHTAPQGGQEFIFTRSAVGQICPLCEQGIGGKIYLKGQLVHLALTRVPVNPRTEMVAEKSMDAIITKKDDAKSIVKELADELDERSLADGTLVVRADGETGSFPTPDPMFKECYDPNTDTYNQDCLNRTLVANMVDLRKAVQPVKSIVDVPAKSHDLDSTSEKSDVTGGNMETEKVEKMQLGGESVPEKPFSYSANGSTVTGDGGKTLADPLPQKAVEVEIEDEKEDDDEMEKSIAALRSAVKKGATVEEVNAAFASLGTAVEKSYQPKSQPVDASNLAEIVKSAVESAVAPLKVEIATLKAQTVAPTKSNAIPAPRSLTLKPSDLMQKAQTSNQPVKQLSQIQKIARKSTGLLDE